MDSKKDILVSSLILAGVNDTENSTSIRLRSSDNDIIGATTPLDGKFNFIEVRFEDYLEFFQPGQEWELRLVLTKQRQDPEES